MHCQYTQDTLKDLKHLVRVDIHMFDIDINKLKYVVVVNN